jgi:hypothetical protein
VSTYFTVSLLFWFLGLMPDLATVRDRASNVWQKRIYGALALGWRGSAAHWHRQQTAYLMLAGLATPLVLSVHSVVSFDFAVAIVPGWHSTIRPQALRSRESHHHAHAQQHGERHARHGGDRCLRLSH